MVNSIETNSTKSSIISGKAVSLKKSVQKGAKAIAQPFKKLKKCISTPLTRSMRSRSSTTSDNENTDHGNEPSADSQGDGSGSEPEVELTPQEELSTLFNYHLVINTNYICIRGTPGALALAHLHLLQIGCRFPAPVTMMAGPLTSSPGPLPNAKYVLVVFVATKIQRIRHLLQTSNTMPYVVLEQMQSMLL
jgi:hypothetical protein